MSPPSWELFEQVYPQHRWLCRTGCEGYYREIFFGNPWRHLDLPSWVAEQGGDNRRLCRSAATSHDVRGGGRCGSR